MTTLYVHKTIVKCTQCNGDFIFPSHISCPSCGEPLSIRAAEDIDAVAHQATTLAGVPPPTESVPQGRGHRPDSFSRALVFVGIALSAAVLACAYWNTLALDPIMARFEFPALIWPFVRYLLIGLGAFGVIQGSLSILFWRSGFHFYRRFRYWN